MAESWEWRVFIPSAQVLGTRLEKYLENACSAENHPTLKAPRTDVYVVVNNDNLVQGGDGIGIKHRGRLGNMELKVRICKACDRRIKGLEKWKKYVIGNTSVGDALKTAELWTGSSGVEFSEADVVEGTVSITKERTKIKSIFSPSVFIIDRIDAAVVPLQGISNQHIAGSAKDGTILQRWISISIEGSKFKSTSKAVFQSGLLDVLEDFRKSTDKIILFGGYPTFVECLKHGKIGSNHTANIYTATKTNAPKVNIFLASESNSKKVATRHAAVLAFEDRFELNRVITQKVSSEVPEQPIGHEQTFKGAVNRVKNFTTILGNNKLYQDLLLGAKHNLVVGIESGLVNLPGCVVDNFSYYDIAWIVIRDLSTGETVSMPSSGVMFPNKFVHSSIDSNQKFTAGSLMSRDNLVVDEKDPHFDLAGMSRSFLLQNALHVGLRNMISKFSKES